MEKISIENINFKSLKKLKCHVSSESSLYHDDREAYKIYKHLEQDELERKRKKLEILHMGKPIPGVVHFEKIVEKNDTLAGVTMNYIHNATTLYDFSKKSNNASEFLRIVKKASLIVKNIHQDPRNIVIGDLNFDNIVYDRNRNPYIVDFDSCRIDDITGDRFPAILALFMMQRSVMLNNVTQTTDKLSLFICTLAVLFSKPLDLTSMYEYDVKADELYTLRNMAPYVYQMMNGRTIPEVPYIDELIDERDLRQDIKIRAMHI